MRISDTELEVFLLRSWAANGGGMLGGVDWLTLLALLAVALVYFLAPVFGYRTRQRGLLLASLWVFIGKMGLALLRVCILALEILDHPSTQPPSSTRSTVDPVFVLMTVFETGLFVLGIALFVIGLSALRREMDLPRALPSDFRDD